MRYSSWSYMMRDVDPHKRYMLLGVVQLMFVALWFFIFFAMSQDAVQYEQRRAGTLHMEQQAGITAQQDIQGLKREVHALEQTIQRYAQQRPMHDRIQRLLKELDAQGIALERLVNHDQQEHEWYTTQQLYIDGQGSLAQITQFLTALKDRVKNLLDVTTVQVQHLKQDIYQVHVELQLYAFKKESPSTLKKAEGLGG